MWLLRLFLGFFCVGLLLADFDEEMVECMGQFKVLEERIDIENLCTFGPQSINCVDDVVKKYTRKTLAEYALLAPPDSRLGRGSITLVNYRSILGDMCTEGTPQNIAVKTHFKCFKFTVESVGARCEEEAEESFETYKELNDVDSCDSKAGNNIESCDSKAGYKENCMVNAYERACMAAETQANCGQGALDAYFPMIRFSFAMKNGGCSDDIMKELKTNFLDSLDMESSRKDLFRRVFDFKGETTKIHHS